MPKELTIGDCLMSLERAMAERENRLDRLDMLDMEAIKHAVKVAYDLLQQGAPVDAYDRCMIEAAQRSLKQARI